MATLPRSDKLDEMIRMLDAAVPDNREDACVMKVKDVLECIVRSGEEFLGPEFLVPAEGCYARRLVHKDPAGRYTVLAMVWDTGQGTSLHDHAGVWCVECVYRGRIKVTSFSLQTPEDAELLQFQEEETIYAGPGEAGALIPPFEYHTILNPDDKPAITVHVYSGELTWCHIFQPVEGGYVRTEKPLRYTE